jgi:type IV pilus assembly protein PilB
MDQPMPAATTLPGLARRLVAEQLLTRDAALKACQDAAQEGRTLIRQLLQTQQVDSAALAQATAQEFGLPLLDLAAFDPLQLSDQGLAPRLLQQYTVLPLRRRGRQLFLGVADPADLEAASEIRFHSGLNIELVVLEYDKLQAALDRLLQAGAAGGHQQLLFTAPAKLELDDGLLQGVEEPRQPTAESLQGDSEAPVVRFVNQLLQDAVHQGASDIHLEPYETRCRVRFRLDGILREITQPPLPLAARICSRLKIMAGLDIAERRLPQDGRIRLQLSRKRAVDFRLNTLPTLWGEKLVLRLLDPGSVRLGIDLLGLEPAQQQLYLEALQRHQGLILVTGPTGSGKTVSLYSGLALLNTGERNISTAEDPVEINLDGINQVAVNPKVGLSFATALRAFLRQDPDVVMVGEIRDAETAEIAIKAAQTGHLVLSTLHTNSAPETLTRLQSMGVAPYNIATSVSLIIAQRLARRLCPHCRQPQTLSPQLLLQAGFGAERIKGLQLFAAQGCKRCHEGYKGRVGIHEVLPMTDRIARAILDGSSSVRIADIAREEGFSDLRRSALEKVAQGITSLAEAHRVT